MHSVFKVVSALRSVLKLAVSRKTKWEQDWRSNILGCLFRVLVISGCTKEYRILAHVL